MHHPSNADKLAHLAAIDASDPLARGALEHRLRQTPSYERLHALIRAKLDATPARPPAPRRHIAPAAQPARAGKERSLDLTPGEASWIAALPSDPAKVSAADATALATVAHEVRTEGDRRLVASRLDPVREHHAALTEARDLERRLYTAPGAVSPLDPRLAGRHNPGDWREVIGEAIQADHPELTEAEARSRVAPLLDGTVEQIRNSYDPAPDRARLADLLRSTGTRSEVYPAAHAWPGEAS